MGTTHQLRRPANLCEKRFVAATLLILALAGLMVSPAWAMSIIGVAPSGGSVLLAPPDPCLPAPQILNFTVTPTTVAFGQSVTLSWNVQVPSGCNYLVAILGRSMPLQGSVQDQPIFDTSYTLTLSWGPTRSLYAIATTPAVSVIVPKDPSDPTGVRNLITISSQQMVPMFVRALSTPNTTVIVNADLDLSGLPNTYYSSRILIGDGVRLVGGRTAVPGQPFRAGPLLFTTDNPAENLFEVVGNNVRVTGVRIQGPDMGVSDNTMSTGLLISDINPNNIVLPAGHISVEIDHSEFAGWSHAGVRVVDYVYKITVQSWVDYASTPAEVVYAQSTEPVYIHDNFIHHNQHSNGNGYGVAVAAAAHALIERNVFDWNRHAISQEDGSSWTGYRAYRNLVLENGGLDQWLYGFGWAHTHLFDMHGQNTCNFIDHYCGTAGHDYDIRYNSFLYTAGAAVKLRGTPEPFGLPYSTVVRFNVFAHANPDDAVQHTEGAPVVQDNLMGRTAYYGLQTCDFDGDGIKDLFIATEQTLWYCPAPSDCVTATGSGKASWVYLNSSTKRTDQLSLGYFSGGRVCDVADGGLISVGGSGPWRQTLFYRAQ